MCTSARIRAAGIVFVINHLQYYSTLINIYVISALGNIYLTEKFKIEPANFSAYIKKASKK